METLGDKKTAKNSTIFCCSMCDYNTSKKNNYKQHTLTRKHQKHIIGDKSVTEGDKKTAKTAICENLSPLENPLGCKNCNKVYSSRNGLWKHKNKCIKAPTNTPLQLPLPLETKNTEPVVTNQPTDKELFLLLIKENSELKNMMMEVIKNGTHNNSHNNNNNKTFNLQVFLNEQCKDALNISEFVEQIKIQLSDLETTGRVGYVEGVSRIINKKLNELDTNKRPIHCSDIKRETLYIKTDNEWTKEEPDKPILKQAIKDIANKNIQKISEWKKANPECTESYSKKNDLYLNIVSNSMSGGTKEEQFTNINKIITKVTKEVAIDKSVSLSSK